MLIQMMIELQHFKITDILNLGGREKLQDILFRQNLKIFFALCNIAIFS